MSKLAEPRLPIPPAEASPYEHRLYAALGALFRQHADQINAVAEGMMHGFHLARTSAPTGIVMQVGDFIPKIDPSETGSTGSKYSLSGWRCVVAGTASATSVVEVRAPTGA